jgi:hypothetical protein
MRQRSADRFLQNRDRRLNVINRGIGIIPCALATSPSDSHGKLDAGPSGCAPVRSSGIQAIVDDFDFTTPDEIKQHPYHQEFLRPTGLQYFAGIKVSTGEDL